MTHHEHAASGSGFRKFFLRGLAILLPSILTIWILYVAYQFVSNKIAQPINAGVRHVVVKYTHWPPVMEEDVVATEVRLKLEGAEVKRVNDRDYVRMVARESKLERLWGQYAFPMDLIGLFIAIVLIYLAGAILGSFLGKRLYARGERMIQRIPLIKQVYPSVKQVTDFLVGSDEAAERNKLKFNRVVGVQYPRKGLWSIGLVTGTTMRTLQVAAGEHCLTVFVPSSPTPFTGYVITVPEKDTIDLPVTIEQALRFTVSGGVIVPPAELIGPDEPAPTPSVVEPSQA